MAAKNETKVAFLTKTANTEKRSVEFKLGNGLIVQVDLASLPKEIVEQLTLHGLSQKIGDAASGFSKARDFSGAFGAMQSVADNLANGLWNAKGSSGTADLVAAIAELKGVDVETAQEAFDKMTEEQVKAVASHPKVKEVVKRLQAERAAELAKASDELEIPGLD